MPLTVDTKLGGTADGDYSAYVVATGGGQTVRTAAAVDRERESYDLTLRTIGRDGKPAPYTTGDVYGMSGAAVGVWESPEVVDGTAKIRVPKGGYVLNSAVYSDPEDLGKGVDWLAQPSLNLTGNTTVTFDARLAKPVDITLPATGTKALLASPDLQVENEDNSYGYGWVLDSYKQLRTAHIGPKATGVQLAQHWYGTWTKGAATRYDIALGGPVSRVATGYHRAFGSGQLAKVTVRAGSSVKGKTGDISAWGELPGSYGGWSAATTQKLPSATTAYVSTADKVRWGFDFGQNGAPDEDGYPRSDASYSLGDPQSLKAGKTYTKTVNTAVFGPYVNADFGVFREDNALVGSLPLFADGRGNVGGSVYSSVKTVLYRNGKVFAKNADPLAGETPITVPAAAADYRLTTSVRRAADVASVSSRIDASWTFRSGRTKDLVALPVSVVRFAPAVALDGTAKAGKTVSVPVTVQGAAAGKNLKSLTVYVSYDAGKTWKKTAVKKGKVSVKNPARKKSLSFKADVTDKKGNKSSVAIYDAYFGK